MESPLYWKVVKEMKQKVDKKLLSLKTIEERFKYIQQKKEYEYKTKRGKRS